MSPSSELRVLWTHHSRNQSAACMLIVCCTMQINADVCAPPEGITGIQTASGVFSWPTSARELLTAIASYQEPSGDDHDNEADRADGDDITRHG